MHLEVDPSLYENDEQRFSILKKNDGLRFEIFSDLLSSHLAILVSKGKDGKAVKFENGYFLGRHEVCFLDFI